MAATRENVRPIAQSRFALSRTKEFGTPEEPKPPKNWEFTGDISHVKKEALIDSFIRPPEEIDYNTKESMDNYNDFIEEYGTYLYDSKYNK